LSALLTGCQDRDTLEEVVPVTARPVGAEIPPPPPPPLQGLPLTVQLVGGANVPE
jgi:hypothetical protein